MAFVTKGNTQKNLAEQERAAPDPQDKLQRGEGAVDESRPLPAARPTARIDKGGFFTIYKSGQGYWTRMGSALSAGLIGILTGWFLFTNLKIWLPADASGHPREKLIMGIVVVLLAAYSLLVYWIMNRPGNADFLIATDSEMKKVNWTSREELIGSTKVVIVFMFLMAIFLFAADIVFGYLFYFLHVLKAKPF